MDTTRDQLAKYRRDRTDESIIRECLNCGGDRDAERCPCTCPDGPAYGEPEIAIDLPYKVEILAAGEMRWSGNALRFATEQDAERYARDLAARWTAVTDWRVADAS